MDMFANNKCLANGGVGVVNRDFYIVLTSEINELKFVNGQKWQGSDIKIIHVVFVFDGKVLLQSEMPIDLDLANCIVN